MAAYLCIRPFVYPVIYVSGQAVAASLDRKVQKNRSFKGFPSVTVRWKSCKISRVAETADKAVVTSGIYQRYFEENGTQYHHIMDRRTGRPADNGLAFVTVIADDGTEADGLATALYVMGEEKAKKYQKNHPEISLILIRKDGLLQRES